MKFTEREEEQEEIKMSKIIRLWANIQNRNASVS